MGNCQNSEPDTNFTQDQWTAVHTRRGCILLQNQYKKNQRVQKWMSNRQENGSIYLWRNSNVNNQMVNILESGSIQLNQIEKISYVICQQLIRLDQLQLTYYEALVISYGAILGFRMLIERFGWFNIQENLIFVNKESKPKVWINSNLAKNSSQYPLQKYSQREFINRLKMVIGKRIANQQILDFNNCYKFYELQQYLKRQICKISPYKTKLSSFIQQNKQNNPQRDYQSIIISAFQFGERVQHSKIHTQICQNSVQLSTVSQQYPRKIKFITELDLKQRDNKSNIPIRDYSPYNPKIKQKDQEWLQSKYGQQIIKQQIVYKPGKQIIREQVVNKSNLPFLMVQSNFYLIENQKKQSQYQ